MLLVWLVLLLACLASAHDPDSTEIKLDAVLRSDAPKPRVAIIGSGIGGAAAAYQLSLHSDADITVFEASDHTGGRIEEVQLADGTLVEMGGSISVAANKHLVSFTDLLNLTRVAPTLASDSIGIWDGSRFVMQLDGGWRSKLKAAARYKVGAWATERLVRKAVRRFERIYSLQRASSAQQTELPAFQHSADLWRYMRLWPRTQNTLSQYLHSQYAFGKLHLISHKYIDEVVAALTHVNYNQAPDSITALAGLIGLAPDSSTFMVRGGMSQVPRGLLEASGARVRTRARATRIAAVPGVRATDAQACALGAQSCACAAQQQQWEVSCDMDVPGQEGVEIFDAVIVAAPLAHANLTLQGSPGNHVAQPPAQEYQVVHSTFVRGHLHTAYFQKQADETAQSDSLPDFIGTSQGSSAPFSSINRVGAVNDTVPLYKMFSVVDPHKAALHEAFEEGAEVVAHRKWYAYPRYDAPAALGPFRLAQGLVYVNAIEAGASCIEISSVGGVNAANLISRELQA